ncbi:MAG: excisionase family DNA-binding protein [Calditrichaeota bacterium]|nr:excisionase family DNA-binding protein [Calditrichota bacterium]MCB9367528.1 excisionase family DNA-binding protein [Calditrichota bacterium]
MANSDPRLDEILRALREIRTEHERLQSPWLTPEHAAFYLGVSRSRIYQYIHEGSIPFHRLPESNLIRLNALELDAWVRSESQPPKQVSNEAIRRILR